MKDICVWRMCAAIPIARSKVGDIGTTAPRAGVGVVDAEVPPVVVVLIAEDHLEGVAGRIMQHGYGPEIGGGGAGRQHFDAAGERVVEQKSMANVREGVNGIVHEGVNGDPNREANEACTGGHEEAGRRTAAIGQSKVVTWMAEPGCDVWEGKREREPATERGHIGNQLPGKNVGAGDFPGHNQPPIFAILTLQVLPQEGPAAQVRIPGVAYTAHLENGRHRQAR